MAPLTSAHVLGNTAQELLSCMADHRTVRLGRRERTTGVSARAPRLNWLCRNSSSTCKLTSCSSGERTLKHLTPFVAFRVQLVKGREKGKGALTDTEHRVVCML